jgi:hypothetical protein
VSAFIQFASQSDKKLIIVDRAILFLVKRRENDLNLSICPSESMLGNHFGELSKVNRARLVIVDNAELATNAYDATSSMCLIFHH